MKIFFAILALIVAVLFAPMLLAPSSTTEQTGPAITTGLPWQLEVQPNGNLRVLGLEIGTDTLEEVRKRYGEGELALVAAPGETETLEFFLDSVTLGGAITGKLVAVADLPADTLAAMRQRTIKTEYMQSATKKSVLADQDLPIAGKAPIHALALIPSGRLTEDIVIQRFGEPAERIRAGEKVQFLLYPERGLGITLDTGGKQVLQYIAPRNFEELKKSFQASVAQAEQQ
jgi:hypothetical protein